MKCFLTAETSNDAKHPVIRWIAYLISKQAMLDLTRTGMCGIRKFDTWLYLTYANIRAWQSRGPPICPADTRMREGIGGRLTSHPEDLNENTRDICCSLSASSQWALERVETRWSERGASESLWYHTIISYSVSSATAKLSRPAEIYFFLCSSGVCVRERNKEKAVARPGHGVRMKELPDTWLIGLYNVFQHELKRTY